MEDKEPKKIFVVTSGEYSDYTIRGIYSAESLAQEYIDMYPPNGDGFRIEEHNLDKVTHKTGFPYYVRFYINTGNSYVGTFYEEDFNIIKNNGVKFLDMSDPTLDIAITAKSPEAALKIASERYMQIKALNRLEHYEPYKWYNYYTNEKIQ